MKLCITAVDNNIEAQVDPRFGRCKFFVIWDSENGESEIIENAHLSHGSGVGVQAAQFVVSKGVTMVITGEVGPKAEQVLKAAAIESITNVNGSVKEAIDKYGKNSSRG